MAINEKEIDLLDLIARIYVLIKKRLIILIVFFVIGISAGIVKYTLNKQNFTYTFIGFSSVVPGEFVLELMGEIKKDITDGSTNNLVSKLNLDNNEIKNLKLLTIDTLRNFNSNMFKLSYNVSDSSLIGSIKSKILTYISGKNYVKERTLLLKIQKDELLKELTRKLTELDSLQKISLNGNVNSGKLMTLNPYYSEYIEMYEKKIRLENEYKAINEKNVIQESLSTVTNLNSHPFRTIIIFGFVGLLLGFGLILFSAMNKKIKNYIKTNL